MRILVTGGAGFIGSAVIRHLFRTTAHSILNVDKLSYCSSLDSTAEVAASDRYRFAQVDITDHASLRALFESFRPQAVMHLAAESHVDRSIDQPRAILYANITGTFELLEVTRDYLARLDPASRRDFRFLHISTDEVYGDLGEEGAFSEASAYAPSSPYSASKAAADHLVRAWYRTYGVPVIVTNCSNNFGPYQYPEKLIPAVILRALRGISLPVYGDGAQVRDWIYVEDNAAALCLVLARGRPGETYVIGASNPRRNVDVVERICAELEASGVEKPRGVTRFSDLVIFVEDRPGHDRRYAIDAAKIKRELGWRAQCSFEQGLERTVRWYLGNLNWCSAVLAGRTPGARPGGAVPVAR